MVKWACKGERFSTDRVVSAPEISRANFFLGGGGDQFRRRQWLSRFETQINSVVFTQDGQKKLCKCTIAVKRHLEDCASLKSFRFSLLH